MMELITIVISSFALVAALFAWGEQVWGESFFGHKVVVKCFPTHHDKEVIYIFNVYGDHIKQ